MTHTLQNMVFVKPVFSILFLITFLSGCSSYGVINNAQQNSESTEVNANYSMASVLKSKPQGKVALALAFSGGGTRAAALAYGVLQELNETKIQSHGRLIPMLEEVDIISAVSGGSFIAAYYGLNGKNTFKDFEEAVLKKDIEDELISELLSPSRWFLDTGRTETAIQLYNSSIFKDATFSDLNRPGNPLILINAADLGNGVRFSFTQEYFDLICSDIGNFSIAKAVTASSAVPVVFNPVVVKNYQPCDNRAKQNLSYREEFAGENIELKQALKGLKDYTETHYPYLHLVDGGITDNLGLRAIYEAIELSGGGKRFMDSIGKQNIKHIAVIAVDASTQANTTMRLTNKIPSIRASVDAMTDIQIHRYNASTLQLFEKSLKKWSAEISTPEKTVHPHFIPLSFSQLETKEQIETFNLIPTSLTLLEEDVNKLIKAGRSLLKNNVQFQSLLQDMDKDKNH